MSRPKKKQTAVQKFFDPHNEGFYGYYQAIRDTGKLIKGNVKSLIKNQKKTSKLTNRMPVTAKRTNTKRTR